MIYITNLYWWDIEVHLQNTKVNGKYLKIQLPFLHFYWHCLNIGIRYKLKKTNFLRSNCYHHNKLKLLKTNLKDNFFQGRNETLCFRLKNYVHLSCLLIHWKINQNKKKIGKIYIYFCPLSFFCKEYKKSISDIKDK